MTAAAPAHIPVMMSEVLEALQMAPDGTYIDGTYGNGGYTRAMLAAGAGFVIAIDRDPGAIHAGKELAAEHPERLRLLQGTFGNMDDFASPSSIDGIALDLGVSSMQLDQAERGFSFQHDGPLDMRMGADGRTAADLVNTLAEADLADLIWRYGEERRSRRIAHAIVTARADQPLSRTGELAALVAKAIPRPDPHHHPATRTFQALRIAVNDELGELERGLEAAEAVLKPGGRCAVVSFHSLEDRIVKTFFRDRSTMRPQGSRHLPMVADDAKPGWRLLTRRPILPAASEIVANPRARSAKLRAAERLTDTIMEGQA